MNAPDAIAIMPGVASKSRSSKRRKHDKILWLIGAWKIFYGLLLLGVGVGAFNLIGKNLSAELWKLVERWNIDFHNYYIQLLFRKATELDGKRLFALTFMTFGYAMLFFIEGVGLILDKHWAKWLVVVVTGSFIPGEIYHLVRQFNWFDLILLIINVACIIYLVWRIKSSSTENRIRTRWPASLRR
ncbi:MAG TPA: DUF2127 domain-containing protein [Verrucomicrobiae bacterium]|jgi:uncharacterized membrane protein (DUF2068 family)